MILCGYADLAQHHRRNLLRRERLRLAQVLHLHSRVVLVIYDLEWPRLDILLHGWVVKSSADEAPVNLLALLRCTSCGFDNSLDIEDGVLRVHSGLILRRFADQALIRCEGNKRRRCKASNKMVNVFDTMQPEYFSPLFICN